MKFFIKLNILSMIYAFVFFVNAELMINVYRIARITGWNIHSVVLAAGTVEISVVILGTILFYFLVKNWMKGHLASFWTMFLWFPYFLLFRGIFDILFPITYGGDKPNPASGLILLGGSIIYPVYVAILNLIGIYKNNTVKYRQ